MIKIGTNHRLKITKALDFGFFVDAENYGEVLLPKKHAPKGLVKGDSVEVFLYLDTEDRPVATTQTPKAKVGEFAYLEAIDNNKIGAFLNWGLDKDLLLPFGEQHKPIEVGKSYLVYLYVDKVDSRITASSKIDKFLDYEKPHVFKANDPVNLIIANSTELGYKAIINHGYWGMLYKNEVHQQLSFGQSIDGFIYRVREDNRIDLRLQTGAVKRDQDEQKIIQYLNENNGYCHLNDKSNPKEISETFYMSKGTFKKTIGNLYKQKVIVIEVDGISLVKTL
jgi:predicted RNA-binding protein (virulence factor B family)